MAQTAGAICVASKIAEQAKPKQVFFMTIDKAKFRKPVEPGDTGRVSHEKLNNRRNMWWYRGEAKVDGVLVCEAEVSAMLVMRMMETIDPSDAPSSRTARNIGAGAKIGPFCTIGPEVELGDGCELISHVALAGRTKIGAAHADLSLRLDRPYPAGPEISRRAVDA